MPISLGRRRRMGGGGGTGTGTTHRGVGGDNALSITAMGNDSPLSDSAAPRRCRRCYGNSRRLPTTVAGPTPPPLLLLLLLVAAVPRARALSEITSVVAPSSNLTAGASHAVEWVYTTDSAVSGTTGDIHPFQIELRSCTPDEDGSCGDSCGNAYRALCGLETGDYCMDSDGSYDVVIPEDVATGTFVFSVTFLGTSGWPSSSSSSSSSGSTGEVSGCSDIFTVEGAESDATEVITATAPSGDLEPGDSFTAEWDFGDESAGNFEVNLYSCAGQACADGSCGTFVSALCGETGCFDPGPGDYDVRVPADATPGQFKLQVKQTSAASSSSSSTTLGVACTADTFQVIASETISPTPAPAGIVDAPTPNPVAAPTPSPIAPPTPAPVKTTAPVPAPTVAPAAVSSSSSSNIPGTPPTPVPARVTCNPTVEVTYSYEVESSTEMPLITIEHTDGDRDAGGCTNFSGLWEWLSTKPEDVPEDLLYPADPDTGEADTSDSAVATGAWLLRSSIDVSNGVMFEIIGTEETGGDADKVFISSSALLLRIRGSGGHLYFYKTYVTSWVETLGEPHILDDDSDGSEARSYIVCLSEMLEEGQTCDGVAKSERGVCRMDILESVITYLGYQETESYGISWKVRGLCTDHSNKEDLFERVRVYGDLQDSEVSGLWFGHYSYGHLGGVWTNNILHDNHVYGFDPHDDSDYLTISGNTCYNNGDHGIIASKRCDHLLVEDNESYNNGGSGLMLHQSCDDSIVRGNNLYGNVDAGFSLVETSRTTVTGNFMNQNKYGIRLLVGSNDNTVSSNEFDSNTQNDIFLYIGSVNDEPLVEGNEGINMRNTFEDNSIVSVTKYTLDMEDSSDTTVTDNFFFGEGGFSFVRCNETRLSGNVGDPTETEAYIEDACFTAGSGLTPECT